MKDPNDTETREITPQKIERRGGWRVGGGRPKADYQTKAMRVDTRLLKLIETLKARLKSGAIDENELKIFEDLAAN
jgi:hypothetical protein